MNRSPLDARDRLFILAVVAQLVVSAVLGVAVVKAINKGGGVQVVGEAPTAEPTATGTATAGSAGSSKTLVTGGSAGSAGSSATAGISATEIKLGGIFTQSGPGDATPALHAAQAYFNTVNRAGGVFGRKLTYITRDDHFDPSIGYADTKDLVENQGVFAMVAWVAPNTENAQTLDYLQRKGVPFVGNFGQPSEYTTPISYSFTLNWTVSPRLTVRMLSKTLGVKKIGIVWAHLTNEIDNIVISSSNAEAKANGAEIVFRQATQVTKAAYDDTVSNARGAGAEGMITILDAYSLARYWQAFARTTWRPKQVSYPFAMDKQPTESIPSGYLDVYAMQEMELPTSTAPAVKEYIDTMKQQYPGDVDKLNWATELCWLGAKMFVEALKRAGPNPTRQGILNALDTMTNFDSGFAPPYTIRPGPHDFVKCAKSAKITASHTWQQFTDWFCL